MAGGAMTEKILVDTSAWIEFYHPKGSPAVKEVLSAALAADEVAVVAPVVVELLSGAKKEADYRKLEEDLKALECLPLGWEEAAVGAVIAFKLARAGKRVPVVDLLIAAAAKRHGYVVWHFGDQHFPVISTAGGPPHRDLKT